MVTTGFLLALLGCATDQYVVVADEFPTPIIEKAPFAISLYLQPSLASQVHSETLPDGSNWTIELGKANTALFREMLGGMFQRVEQVSTGSAKPGTKVLIKPVVTDYQFSTPEQSKSDYFETWIQYQMLVYKPDGQLVADWPFSAYGRSRAELLDTEESLRQATRRAMRDAGTAIVVELMKQPGMRAHFYGSAKAGG